MGNTPLIAAVDRGDAFEVRNLLSDPATDCEKTNRSGQTAIHLAARWGNAYILNLLLRNPLHRPELNRLDTARGYAPLHYAAAYGCPRCVAALLEAGADPRLRTGTSSIAGLLPAALVAKHASHTQDMYKTRIRAMLEHAAALAASQQAPLLLSYESILARAAAVQQHGQQQPQAAVGRTQLPTPVCSPAAQQEPIEAPPPPYTSSWNVV